MFDFNHIKKYIFPAVVIIICGAALFAGTYFYGSQKAETDMVQSASDWTEENDTGTADNLSAKKVVYTVEEGWTPSPDELNLAHIFPEGADTDEISESYAGMAFNSLVRHESSWWSQVYSSAGMTPFQLAVQLGRDPSSVYSSSGEVKSFKSIHMNVVNGDGTPVNLRSNIIQIMSMANVYFYYHDPEDYDGFLSYCQDLFDRSHSYSVSMSGVYYCDGSCQNSSIDSEEFDEDFFTFDTNFNIDEDSTEPLSYFYEPIYETAAETDEEGSDLIITGEARQAFEDSLEFSSVGPTVAEEERTFDEDEFEFFDDFDDDITESTVAQTQETLPEETVRETRSRIWQSETEEETLSDEDAQAQALAEAQAFAEAQALAEAQAAAQAQALAEAQAAAEAEAYAQAQALAEAQAAAALFETEEDITAETESQAPIIHAGTIQTTEASYEEEFQESYEDIWETTEVFDSEIVEYYDTASSSDAESEEGDTNASSQTSSSTTRRSTARCPGHVDLTINIRIYDLDGEKNLFTLDLIGSKADEIIEETDVDNRESEEISEDIDEEISEKDSEKLIWPGWEEEQRTYVDILCDQDWYEKYGLSLSTFSFGNPLTPSEIKRYMDMLPEDLSETRKKVIEFALQSVGRVPYYWGGKPSHAGYEGNNFGMLIDPDHSGRVLKGLDCSGWVGWVYWSVMGVPSPAESTSTLCSMGEPITLSEMQPGDIAVRTGSSAHVIMFLGWAEDGNILCIHESSAGVNNVTIAERAPSWPYYRSIFD